MAAGLSTGQRRARHPGGRGVRVVVRVSTEEYATLAGRAAASGLTVPSYLAAAGLAEGEVPAAQLRAALTAAAALRRLLAAVTAAVDAVAAAHPTDPRLPDLYSAVDRVADRVAASLTALDHPSGAVDGSAPSRSPRRGGR